MSTEEEKSTLDVLLEKAKTVEITPEMQEDCVDAITREMVDEAAAREVEKALEDAEASEIRLCSRCGKMQPGIHSCLERSPDATDAPDITPVSATAPQESTLWSSDISDFAVVGDDEYADPRTLREKVAQLFGGDLGTKAEQSAPAVPITDESLREENSELAKRARSAMQALEVATTFAAQSADKVAAAELALASAEQALRIVEQERDELRERIPDAKAPGGAMNEALALACRTARNQRDAARKDLADALGLLEIERTRVTAVYAAAESLRAELVAEREVVARLRNALRAIAKNNMPPAHTRTHDAKKCDAVVCIAQRALGHLPTMPLELEREQAQLELARERDLAQQEASAKRDRIQTLTEALRKASHALELLLTVAADVTSPDNYSSAAAAAELATNTLNSL